jgi:large subunit ribosomal protein L28
MSRRCMVTGKGVQSGNNVSHANNKTRRKFLPNVQDKSIYSEALGRTVKIRLSAHGLRTLTHKGLDEWLVDTAPTKLDPALRKIRAQVVEARASK